MKKLNLFLIVITLFLSGKMFAQGMLPPPPINSPFVDAVIGTWVSEPYEMMGMKMSDEVTHTKILNGQFMEIVVKGKADNGFTYEGKGIIAPSADGTMTGWFYDIFGKDAITTYTGNANGNNISLTGTSNWGTEKRDITINGDTMIHYVTLNMKDQSGKEMPQQKITITYKKKK